jgi:hypothetical protein
VNEEGHRRASAELQASRARLVLPDDVRAYVEVSFGLAFHLLAAGAERRHGAHRENHQGLSQWLRARGHPRQADLWTELESVRNGRWYGRQGNGNTARHIDELVGEIEAWSLA